MYESVREGNPWLKGFLGKRMRMPVSDIATNTRRIVPLSIMISDRLWMDRLISFHIQR